MNLSLFQKLYDRFTGREKLLLTATLWVVLFIWAMLYVGRLGAQRSEFTRISTQLETQAVILEREPQIDQQLQDQLERLNPESTFGRNQLIARAESITRTLSVANQEISTVRTRTSDDFDFHEVKVTLRRATLKQVIGFEEKVRDESPYLSLESVKLTADSGNPELITATFVLKSFELRRSPSGLNNPAST